MKVLLACVMAGSLLGTTPASAKVDIRFPVTAAYPSEFQDWFNLTDTATRFDEAQTRAVFRDLPRFPSQ
jgi:hypothetical protein